MKVSDLIHELSKLDGNQEVFLEYRKTDCCCGDGNGENRCYCPEVTHRDSVESVDLVKLDERGKYINPPVVVLNYK